MEKNNKIPSANNDLIKETKVVNKIPSANNDLIKETKVVNKIFHTIYNICDLAGYTVENRIVLKNRITGKEWI